jgi:hypothetical protein
MDESKKAKPSFWEDFQRGRQAAQPRVSRRAQQQEQRESAVEDFLQKAEEFEANEERVEFFESPPTESASPSAESPPPQGFLDDFKEGFAAAQPQSSLPPPTQTASPPADSQPKENFVVGLMKSLFAEPTEEERIAARIRAENREKERKNQEIAQRIRDGEGVIWSADYSRAWRGKDDIPGEEISVKEAKNICRELGLEIPPEADEAKGWYGGS